MKILGNLGTILDGCTHGMTVLADKMHTQCEAIDQQYTGVLTLFLHITGLGHAPS